MTIFMSMLEDLVGYTLDGLYDGKGGWDEGKGGWNQSTTDQGKGGW